MASLTKRGKYWSIVFKKHVDGKSVRKTYALGTKYKKVAKQKKTDYERLYDEGKIDPFNRRWNLKEYEESLKSTGAPSTISSIFIEDLKKEFLKTKSHTSDHNLRAYNSILKLFKEDVGRSMPIGKIQPSDIRSFCFQDRLANATQRNYLKYLKTFFKWLTNEDIIETDPTEEIKPPRKKDKLVEKMIREYQLKTIFRKFRELQKVKREAGYIKDFRHMRFWFKPVITTAFYTGMRRGELLQLRWEHVDLGGREVHVTNTKNGKERSVVLFDSAYQRLKAWRKFIGNPENGLVFPSPKSNKKMEIQLMGDTVSKTFKSIIRKSTVKNTVHFHGLRHSCATFMLRQGFDVIEVKEMLGHKSIEITNRYVHLLSDDRKNKAEKLGLITN